MQKSDVERNIIPGWLLWKKVSRNKTWLAAYALFLILSLEDSNVIRHSNFEIGSYNNI
jgi:hypothetical protein